MRLTFRVRLLLAPLLAFTFLTNAGSAGKAEEKAIRAGKIIGQRDLGVWDDVFACGADRVITGAYLWQSTGSTRERKAQVNEATIQLQR